MCDTMVALPPATADGGVLFAKNSDRERNEAQPIEWHARARHASGAALRCTYITIPQAAETHAVLLSRPFWCWGAEIGANEHGVVIGNEAVFATIPPSREPALIGMDLVRLGLERASSAAAAVDVITTLLEAHGQGGDCGHLHEHFYDNGFLVADAREAFVIETIGRHWAVERVAGIRAISNALSIGRGGIERASASLVAEAGEGGLAGFDLAARYLNEARDAVSRGRLRCDRATTLLRARTGALTRADMMRALRDHGAGAGADWHPAHTIGRTICMHAGEGERRGQTVASMVSELRADGRAVHWVTAASAPCTAIFRPLLPGIAIPPHGPSPTDQADPASRWWRHEALHRAATTGDFAGWLATIAAARDAAEARFAARIEEALRPGGDPAGAVAACWREADAIEAAWPQAAPLADVPVDHRSSWTAHDALARQASRRSVA
ncbi:peptidase U34 [Roseomonas eburnea]|uniref:Dipeptidase n=1 Tax=Neoroseomonas eburnea TaxID=1346889 RepID=A0A9X9X911_9PROT|nr:C69 family dipeptidase [Neoroseomonas eburnea]MBR0680197.1 peptidase U34 [Neoroseomonas eburnea]